MAFFLLTWFENCLNLRPWVQFPPKCLGYCRNTNSQHSTEYCAFFWPCLSTQIWSLEKESHNQNGGKLGFKSFLNIPGGKSPGGKNQWRSIKMPCFKDILSKAPSAGTTLPPEAKCVEKWARTNVWLSKFCRPIEQRSTRLVKNSWARMASSLLRSSSASRSWSRRPKRKYFSTKIQFSFLKSDF